MTPKYHDTFYHGDFYHIFNRGNNQEVIFKSERNYSFFLERWQKYLAEFLDVYSYCLIPTHFHFFSRVKEQERIAERITKLEKFIDTFPNPERIRKRYEGEKNGDTIPNPQRIRNRYDAEQPDINEILENQFKLFFRSYALAFNKENERSGSLFQKRFKRIRVDNPKYFTAVIHYIHNNPIHHHHVDAYEKWKFSSYHAILSDQPTQVMRDEVLQWFGSKKKFIEFHLENVKFKEIKPYVELS
jgi:REP element-mobilizing transposase RayT